MEKNSIHPVIFLVYWYLVNYNLFDSFWDSFIYSLISYIIIITIYEGIKALWTINW